MAGLDFLFQGAAPASVTGTIASQDNLPEWYQEYLRGVAGKATQVAGEGYTPYPGARLADFNPDQLAAFQKVRANQGAWAPAVGGALDAANTIMPTALGSLGVAADYAAGGVDASKQYGGGALSAATGAGAAATGAVAGPAQQWTGNVNKYLSPYTKNVVDEIARVGNQNLTENIVPGVQSQFIGSGGFGSTRNADILGRAVRDAQTNISGLQAQALDQGYRSAADIFGADANREQQQQQLQANTNLNAGRLGADTNLQAGQLVTGATGAAGQMATSGAQIGAAAADTAAGRYGNLGALQQSLGSNDAAALGAVGGAQQGLTQAGYDKSYDEFVTQRDWDRNNIGFLNAALRGMPMPNGTTTVSNQPTSGYGTSPLGWIGALYGMNNANNTARPGG